MTDTKRKRRWLNDRRKGDAMTRYTAIGASGTMLPVVLLTFQQLNSDLDNALDAISRMELKITTLEQEHKLQTSLLMQQIQVLNRDLRDE